MMDYDMSIHTNPDAVAWAKFYTETRARFAAKNPGKWNPYGALPQMRLLTYQMPDELLAIASAGEFDEFDLNAFFEASGTGANAQFKHKSDVQKWLNIIREIGRAHV